MTPRGTAGGGGTPADWEASKVCRGVMGALPGPVGVIGTLISGRILNCREVSGSSSALVQISRLLL